MNTPERSVGERHAGKRASSVFLRKKFNSMFLAYLATWIIATVSDMADSILAGIFINTDAVSAVELVFPTVSIIMFLCSFCSIGASTLYPQAQGRFDTKTAYRIVGVSTVVSVGLGIAIAGTMWLCKDLFFGFYASSPAVEALAREYYDCVIPVGLIYPIYWLVYYLVANDGNANLCVIVDFVNIAVNALVSVLLVGKMGIRGLGYGTVIALLVSGLVMCTHFFSKKSSLRFRFCFDLNLLGKIASLGSAMSMTYLYIGLVDIIINKFIIKTFGSPYLAPYVAVNLMLNMCDCFISPMSAASPFVSVSFGERNPAGIRRVMRLVNGGIWKVSIAFIAVFELLAPLIPGLYGISDPTLAGVTVYAVRVIPLSYGATALVMTLTDYLPKIEKVFLGNFISFAYMFLAPLIFPVWFSGIWGYRGLVWGFFLTPIFALGVYFLCVWLKYGIRKFPYLIPDTDDKIFIHELAINEENVIALNDTVGKELSDLGINPQIIGRIQLILEESFLIVRDKTVESAFSRTARLSSPNGTFRSSRGTTGSCSTLRTKMQRSDRCVTI